jgi:ABC-type glycerol-3-phosphate transport system substrate-binding protein
MRRRPLLGLGVLLAGAALLGLPGAAGAIETVRYLNQETDPAVVAIQRAWVEDFVAKNPGTDIILEAAPAQVINQRIATYVQAGAPLDVVHSDPGSGGRLAAAGLLAPLDDVVERLGGRDAFLPNRLLIVDDQVFAINQAAATPQWHYRKDLFEEAGLEPPTNWEELLHAAKTLHSDEVAGIALAGGENRMTTIMSSIFLWQNCHDFFDADLNLTVDHERTAEAVAMYAELLKYAPPDAAAWSFLDPVESFWAGRSAMVLHWFALDLALRQNPDMVENIGLGPVIQNRMQVTQMGGRYIGVFANSPSLEVAKDWIEYMFTAENAQTLTEIHPMLYPPVTHEAVEALRASSAPAIEAYGDLLFDVVYPAAEHSFNEILDGGGIDRDSCTMVKTGQINPYVNVLWNSNLYARAVQQVAYGSMSPEQAVAEAHKSLAEQIEVMKREMGEQ